MVPFPTISLPTFAVACFLFVIVVYFLDDSHSDWNDLSVVLICISSMTKDVEHVFVYLLAICTSVKNCLFTSFAYLLVLLFVLLVFNFWSSSYILDINLLSNESLQGFLPFCRLCLDSGNCFLCCWSHLLVPLSVRRSYMDFNLSVTVDKGKSSA
jgi:hypothetical protein